MENENLARTVGKALDILDCLGREKTCLSASEVARHCRFSRPTAYRLLHTLLTRGYVTQDRSQEEKYRLGYKILELSKSLLDSVELRQQALPFLQDLSRTVNETVHLAVLDRGEVVYIEKVESTQPVRMHSTIGSRNPVHCTALGKAILAYLPPGPQAAVLERASWPNAPGARLRSAPPYRPISSRCAPRALPWTIWRTRRASAASARPSSITRGW
jgi:DNA-binding IclR family transcriptional regulator